MNTAHQRRGFTLVEVLIVVVIMAVLAATIIPQFGTSTIDAYKSEVKFNAHFINSQVELYRDQHNSVYPPFATFVQQMTQASDVYGNTSGDSTTLVYGPYVAEFPLNPFTTTSTVVQVAVPGVVPTAAVAGGAGWQYDETIGLFFPNNPEAFQPGF